MPKAGGLRRGAVGQGNYSILLFFAALQRIGREHRQPGRFRPNRNGNGHALRSGPMVCSPDDALIMFYGSDLQNLALGDFLVRKTKYPASNVSSCNPQVRKLPP